MTICERRETVLNRLLSEMCLAILNNRKVESARETRMSVFGLNPGKFEASPRLLVEGKQRF
jgi:hypothetical protein